MNRKGENKEMLCKNRVKHLTAPLHGAGRCGVMLPPYTQSLAVLRKKIKIIIVFKENLLTLEGSQTISNLYSLKPHPMIMLKEKGHREVLADAMYDHHNGVSLEELVSRYQITESELQFLANSCAAIDYMSHNQTRGKTRNAISCTVAVAGSVACSISAMTITTPAGLGIFLVSKALATVSIAKCAS
jgi:hypothetical protein